MLAICNAHDLCLLGVYGVDSQTSACLHATSAGPANSMVARLVSRLEHSPCLLILDLLKISKFKKDKIEKQLFTILEQVHGFQKIMDFKEVYAFKKCSRT